MHLHFYHYRDIEKVHDGVGTNLGILVQYVSTFAAGVLCALYLNWSMTLLLLVITPFIVVPSGVFNQVILLHCIIHESTLAPYNTTGGFYLNDILIMSETCLILT